MTYTDTSELPVLSSAQLQTIHDRLSSVKGKLVMSFNGSDEGANIFANDLLKTLKDAGWDVDYRAGFGGGGIQNSVPLVIGVSSPNTKGAGPLQHVLQSVLGIQVPGIVDPKLPEGQIEMAIISHPVKRQQ